MLKPTPVPVLGFAAYSGSGKTTLLIELLPLLKQHGLRVGLIKHTHHSFEIDYPGKDSYELRKAGAGQLLIGSKQRWALMVESDSAQGSTLTELIQYLHQDRLDLILNRRLQARCDPQDRDPSPKPRQAFVIPNRSCVYRDRHRCAPGDACHIACTGSQSTPGHRRFHYQLLLYRIRTSPFILSSGLWLLKPPVLAK